MLAIILFQNTPYYFHNILGKGLILNCTKLIECRSLLAIKMCLAEKFS